MHPLAESPFTPSNDVFDSAGFKLVTKTPASLKRSELERKVESLNSLILENDALDGFAQSLILSYLGNVQIVQIIFGQENVSETVKNFDKLPTTTQLENTLAVLALKLEQVVLKTTLKIKTNDNPSETFEKPIRDLLSLKSKLSEIDLKELFINDFDLKEVSKILFLLGAKKIKIFDLRKCMNIKHHQLANTLSLYKSSQVHVSSLFSNVPTISDRQFSKFLNYFKGTSFEINVDELKMVSVTKNFPSVLCIKISDITHYFNYDPTAIDEAMAALLTRNPISLVETKLLLFIKKKWETQKQFVIDVRPDEINEKKAALQEKHKAIEIFQVPSRKKGYISLAYNIPK